MTMEHMGLVDSLIVSVLGMIIVFFVLVLLSFFIRIISKIMAVSTAKKAPQPVAAAAAHVAAAPVADPNKVPAPGSLGQLKLFDVDDQTAAMVMAIVADELKAPLNELRFISIKERKKD